tara:strand:- start:99 stop:299 length:201 start_codon:yes stop_codon:yes gene_type:complete
LLNSKSEVPFIAISNSPDSIISFTKNNSMKKKILNLAFNFESWGGMPFLGSCLDVNGLLIARKIQQ